MNSFGDANFVIRSSAFDRIGGFTEDRDLSYEDWEFLARAQLIGFEVGIVPESLFWKRTLGDSMLRSNARDPYRTFMSEWRTIRPFVDTLPLGYGERLQLARRAAMQSSGSGIETPLIASTWEDWVGKQGNRGWTFGHRTRTAEGLGPFVPFGQKENTEKGVELYADPPLPRWLHVARGKQHGAITGSGAHVVVRRWASNTLARAEVKLSAVRPDHKMNCGDGSKISIDLIGKSDRGHSLAERILGPKDKEGVLMTEIDVKPDTVLEFRQDPLSDAECDELWLRATVSAA